MPNQTGARVRVSIAAALLAFAGLTCTDSTGVRRSQARVGFAPVFTDASAAIYSNLVDGGLAINNFRILLKRSDSTVAKDTVITYNGVDSVVVIDLTIDIDGASAVLNARIDLRADTLVLFSGTQDIVAVAGTLPGETPEIEMEYDGPGATVVALDLAPADSAITVADSIVYRPTAKNSDSVNVTDFAVLWSVKDPTRGTINTAGVFKPLPGRGSTYVFAKTYTDVIDSARVSVTPVATKLVVISGNAQTGPVNGNLPQLLVVESQAADNLPVPNVTATLIGPPGTVVLQMTNKTDQNGRISFTVPVGTIAGPISFSVTSPGLPDLALTGTATAGPLNKLAVTQQPATTAASGAALATQPKVQLQDAFGNSVAVAGKAVVASLTTAAGRVLGGTTTINTDASGVATFTNLVVSGPPGSFTLKFTQDTLTAATSNAIALGVGAAAKVVLTTRPSASVLSGGTFAQQPVARITDAFGNTVTSSGASVTATAGAGYTMVGSATVVAGSGVATFTDLGVSGTPASTLLTFASAGLASDTATVSVLPAFGPAASITAMSPIAFVDSIQATVATANLAAVLVKDAQNVPVPNAPVTFKLYGGQGSLIDGVNGSSTIPTAADGVAMLPSQRLRDSIGVDSIEITTPGVPDTVWILAGVLNGKPHHMAVLSQPSNTTANQPFSVFVVLQDRLNNITVNLPDPPNITIAIKGGTGAGGAVLSANPSALTQVATAGVATFAASIDLAATGYVLTVSSPAAPTIDTDAFDILVDAPNVVQWANAAGGNWSVGSNWVGGVAPTSADIASLDLAGTYNVTLDVSPTVAGLVIGGASGNVTLTASSKTITVNGPSSISENHVLSLTSSTITGSGSLDNSGTILAFGVSAINVPFYNADGSTLRVRGQTAGSNANLTFATGWTNDGYLELTSANGSFSSTVTVTSGTLVNVGNIASVVDAGGSRAIAGQIENQGNITTYQNLTLNKAGADHLNSGSIDITTGNLIVTLTGTTPTFTNTGTITLTANRDISISGGESNFSSGVVQGPVNSTFIVSSSLLSFSTSTILVPVNLAGASGVIGELVTVPTGETLRLLSGTLTADLDVQAGGTVITHGNVAITGSVTNAGTIQVKGQSFGSNATLTVANGFTNDGQIELTTQDASYSSSFNVTSGSLINSPSGTVTTSVGAGGSRTLGAQLENHGILDVNQALTISKTDALHVSDGTIDLTGAANLTITQSGSSPSFTNSGGITLGAGRTLTISGGAVDLAAGNVTGTATSNLTVNSATLAFTPSSVTIPMTLLNAPIVGGSVTVGGDETLSLLSGGLTDPVTVESGGLLRTYGTVSLANLDLQSNSVLQPKGQSNGGHSALTVANGFTNNGLIELVSADGGYSSALTVTSGTLTNAAGATIHSIVGAGGSRTLSAQLDNAGTLDIDQPLTLTKASANHVNSGAIDASVNLTLTQSGTSPSFTNTGTITLAAGRDFSVSGVGGILDLSAGSLTGTATSTLIASGQLLSFTPTTVTIPMTLTTTNVNGGSLAIGSTETVTLLGGGLVDPVTINSGGTLLTHGAATLAGAVTLSAGGTLRVLGQGNGGHASLTVASGFTNSGLIDLLSADGGYSSTLAVTTGTLVNATGATIHSIVGAGGSRTLNAQIDNQGTLDVDQDLTLSKADAVHVSSGAIDLTTADLTLTQSGTTPSFESTGSVTLGANRTWTVNGGTLDIDQGTVTGPTNARIIANTVSLGFTTGNVTLPLTLNTTSIIGGTVTIPSAETLTLLGGGVSDAIVINPGGTLLTHGSVALGGALTVPSSGTVRVRGQGTGGHAVLTVASGFTNSGTIQLISADGGYASTLAVTSGTLVNASGALIHSAVGAGGSRSLAAQLDNQGTVDVDQALTLNKTEADHSNSGSIDLSNADFTLSQSGTTPTFSQSAGGTVTLGANRAVTVNGGFVDFGQGSVTGPVSANFIATGAILAFTPSTITVPLTLTTTTIQGGSVTIGTSQSITLLGGGLSDPVTINSGGTLLTHGNVSLGGTMTLSGGNLRVQGQGNGGHATLTIADGFTNTGLIELISADGGYSSTLAITTGTLTNSATIHSAVGAGGSRTLAAKLSNNGTLDVDQALTLNKADVNHYNASFIDLTNANLTVTQTGTAPSFGNGISGVITLGASRQLVINGGTANFTGSSVVQGDETSKLAMTNGTLNFTPAHVTVPMTLTNTAISGGTVTIASGGVVTLRDGALSAAVTVQNGGILQAQGGAAVSSVVVEPGGTLNVLGRSLDGHATLTVDNGLVNDGSINLTSQDGGYASTLNVTTGSLTNTGTILSDPGNGGSRTIGAQLNNQGGTIDVDQALAINKADAAHFSNGYIDLTDANLTVTQTGTSPTFTHHGTIQLAAGRMLTVAGGTFTNVTGDPSGTIQGPGTLNVSTTAFTNFANLNPGSGTLSITGNYTQNAVNGGSNFVMTNTGCVSHGVVAVSGTVALDGALNVSLNDCLPVLNAEFTIMTFASSTGTFTTTNLPDLSTFGFQWQVQYNATNVKLKVIPGA
jgi:hypothetical protein